MFAAVAFFMNLAKPVAPVAAVLTPDLGVGAGALEAGAGALEAGAGALEAGVGAVAHPFFRGFNPLTFILASLGIPVEHLVEGSRKCVTELGPEAVGAVKSLLVKGTPDTTPFPAPVPCACCPPSRPPQYGSTPSTPLNPTQGSRHHDKGPFPAPRRTTVALGGNWVNHI